MFIRVAVPWNSDTGEEASTRWVSPSLVARTQHPGHLEADMPLLQQDLADESDAVAFSSASARSAGHLCRLLPLLPRPPS